MGPGGVRRRRLQAARGLDAKSREGISVRLMSISSVHHEMDMRASGAAPTLWVATQKGIESVLQRVLVVCHPLCMQRTRFSSSHAKRTTLGKSGCDRLLPRKVGMLLHTASLENAWLLIASSGPLSKTLHIRANQRTCLADLWLV
jgi:hypothetical protein